MTEPMMVLNRSQYIYWMRREKTVAQINEAFAKSEPFAMPPMTAQEIHASYCNVAQHHADCPYGKKTPLNKK